MHAILTPQQWVKLLAVLSLDCVLPLYEEMYFPLTDKVAFQGSLRDVIIKARQSFNNGHDKASTVLEMLSASIGDSAMEQLICWSNGAFLGYHADQPEWSAWDIVFSQWAYSRRRELEFLPEQKQNLLVASYCSTVDTDNVKHTCAEIQKAPLSEWDLDMFVRQGFGIAWESGPYSTVESIVRIERLKRWVALFVRHLTSEEVNQVCVHAQSMVTSLGVWMPGPLTYLDVLLTEV